MDLHTRYEVSVIFTRPKYFNFNNFKIYLVNFMKY